MDSGGEGNAIFHAVCRQALFSQMLNSAVVVIIRNFTNKPHLTMGSTCLNLSPETALYTISCGTGIYYIYILVN